MPKLSEMEMACYMACPPHIHSTSPPASLATTFRMRGRAEKSLRTSAFSDHSSTGRPPSAAWGEGNGGAPDTTTGGNPMPPDCCRPAQRQERSMTCLRVFSHPDFLRPEGEPSPKTRGQGGKRNVDPQKKHNKKHKFDVVPLGGLTKMGKNAKFMMVKISGPC